MLPNNSPSSTKDISLGDEINYKTASLHHELNMIIMSRLPLGLKDPRAFHEGLMSFSVLYAAFEASLDAHIRSSSTPSRTRAILENVYIPAIHRAAAFEGDLNRYEEENKDEKDEPKINKSSPARAYVTEYVRQTTTEQPHLLLAYIHCLYMALFAGGQHIKAAIARAAIRKLALAQHQTVPEEAKTAPGIAIFAFEGRSTKEELELRQKLRDGLRASEELLTPKERAEVLNESCEVFKLTRRLVDELDVICATTPTVLLATKQYTESESPTVAAPMEFSKTRQWNRLVKKAVRGAIVLSLVVGYVIYRTAKDSGSATVVPLESPAEGI
ncbi:hypothetical protein ABW19_dt0208732 [Dactylella cylindrospora]|nr:hypothetical protein ABW19_dt0208732 [Dactylella cylindrospora]